MDKDYHIENNHGVFGDLDDKVESDDDKSAVQIHSVIGKESSVKIEQDPNDPPILEIRKNFGTVRKSKIAANSGSFVTLYTYYKL